MELCATGTQLRVCAVGQLLEWRHTIANLWTDTDNLAAIERWPDHAVHFIKICFEGNLFVVAILNFCVLPELPEVAIWATTLRTPWEHKSVEKKLHSTSFHST